MLTKDLIRATNRGGRLYPRFVDPEDEKLQRLAAELLGLFTLDSPPTRGELDTEATQLIGAMKDVKLGRGLFKLLLDRADFAHPTATDCPALRARLFATSAAHLAAGPPEELDAFRTTVLDAARLPEDFLAAGIYADLPENEELASFRELAPQQLLERYNVALVQSLLLTAGSLELRVRDRETARLRRAFKYLKFFRLLAVIREEPADDGEPWLHATVDGPGSVLAHSKKYGLQLASFFPAVCALEQWELSARVEVRGTARELRLDQSSGLRSHYRNWSAYVPEEIRVFHRLFKAQGGDWEIVGQTPMLHAGGQEVIFPDLSFQDKQGHTVHLELFHRWHAGPLRQRLELLSECPELPLAIGVDRAVERQGDMADLLAASKAFRRRGFLFRDFPTVKQAVKCLDNTIGKRQRSAKR